MTSINIKNKIQCLLEEYILKNKKLYILVVTIDKLKEMGEFYKKNISIDLETILALFQSMNSEIYSLPPEDNLILKVFQSIS